MSPTVHVVFRLALQMGSTGESEGSCATEGEVIPNGSSSERKRIDARIILLFITLSYYLFYFILFQPCVSFKPPLIAWVPYDSTLFDTPVESKRPRLIIKTIIAIWIKGMKIKSNLCPCMTIK